MPDLLRIEGLRAGYGEAVVLPKLSLGLAESQVLALLGRNGAGKTTTLRTIMGLWKASAGGIAFAGKPIQAMATPDIARLGIAYVPETMGIFSQLTVRENMVLASTTGRFEEARLDGVVFALFPVLREKWHSAAGSLSGGQKQMLAISRAIIEERRLLIVDEPTKGLAPAVIEHLIDGFQKLKQSRATILLVEQNFHMARSLGDDVAVMDDGRVVHTGPMADLAADEALQERLLGLSLASHQ